MKTAHQHPKLFRTVSIELTRMLARGLENSPSSEELPLVAEVLTEDLVAVGLSDRDTERVRYSLNLHGRSAHRWPTTRDVRQLLPRREEPLKLGRRLTEEDHRKARERLQALRENLGVQDHRVTPESRSAAVREARAEAFQLNQKPCPSCGHKSTDGNGNGLIICPECGYSGRFVPVTAGDVMRKKNAASRSGGQGLPGGSNTAGGIPSAGEILAGANLPRQSEDKG